MACKRGDDDPPLRLLDDLVQLAPHFAFRLREIGVVRVRGIGEHEVDSRVSEPRDRAEIGVNAIDGALIEFEVARVKHVARRRREEDAERTGDRVVHGEELRLDVAQLDLIPRLHLDQVRAFDAVLLELALDEPERHLRAVNRHLLVEVLVKVRQAAGMVLVAVRDDDAAQLVGMLEHIGVIGQDEVDAGMVVVGEHDAGIVEHHVVSALEHRHVLADGVEAAERDDLELSTRLLLR